MATVVNNPAPAREDGSGMGFLLGVILLIVFAVLFFLYGLPYLTSTFSGPQVNVPGQIDVNVNNPK
jgi:hypothetical protein